MRDRLRQFSDFVRNLNAAAQERSATEVLGWSVNELSGILGFDSAWYGWAEIREDGPVIHANATFNLPEDYFARWREMSAQDLLVAQFQEDPRQVPTYDRGGRVHTDGMQHLADTFGLKKMATAMNLRPGRSASLWMSAYRGGELAQGWSEAECEFLQYAVDHVAASARLAQSRDGADPHEETRSILINEQGVVVLGLDTMRARFGHIWSRQDGDRVPRCLAEFIDQPGEHLLIDRGLVARCELLPEPDGVGLQKLSLRPMQKFDLLTRRERSVALILADGKSHKEAARALGVAPSTVRNQTRSIYEKLGIDNRAKLAALIPAG